MKPTSPGSSGTDGGGSAQVDEPGRPRPPRTGEGGPFARRLPQTTAFAAGAARLLTRTVAPHLVVRVRPGGHPPGTVGAERRASTDGWREDTVIGRTHPTGRPPSILRHEEAVRTDELLDGDRSRLRLPASATSGGPGAP